MLTDGESRNGAVRWSNKGDRFAFFTTKRNGRDHDLHVGDLGSAGDTAAVLEREGIWSPLDWSPDDTNLLVMHYVSINESYLYVLDVTTGALLSTNRTDAAELGSTVDEYQTDHEIAMQVHEHVAGFVVEGWRNSR